MQLYKAASGTAPVGMLSYHVLDRPYYKVTHEDLRDLFHEIFKIFHSLYFLAINYDLFWGDI